MSGLMNFADIYGENSKAVSGVDNEKTVNAASGDIQQIEQNKNASFSWLAFAALLVLMRVIWELAE